MFKFNDPPALDSPDKDWSLERTIQDRQSEESRMRVNEEAKHVKEKNPTIKMRVLKKHNWFVCLFSKKKREERKQWEKRWGKYLKEAQEIEIEPMKYEPHESFYLNYTYKNTKNTMSKHTAGPWIFENRDGDHPLNDQNGWGCNGLWAVNGGFILGDGQGWDSAYQAPNEADARLIAAAPELLEALKVFVEYSDQGGPLSFDTDAMWAQARAAIAKAEGGSHE